MKHDDDLDALASCLLGGGDVTRDDETKALVDRFAAAIDDANNSRPGSREALRQLASEHPEVSASLADDYGDMAKNAEKALIHSASGGNVLVDESVRAWSADMRRALAEPGDTELEAMLVHRVALCWLAVNTAERLRSEKWKGGISTEAADFWDRHTARLNADFLKASRMLATIRKLRRPVVQVNIAEQQVNVVR